MKKITIPLTLFVITLICGCQLGAGKLYRKIHAHVDVDWTAVDPSIATSFPNFGTGRIDVEMLFPTSGGESVAQVGKAYLDTYGSVPGCTFDIPDTYDVDGVNVHFAKAVLTIKNETPEDADEFLLYVPIRAMELPDEPIMATCPNLKEPLQIQDQITYKLLATINEQNTEAIQMKYQFILDEEVKESEKISLTAMIGNQQFTGHALIKVTDLGIYDEKTLRAMKDFEMDFVESAD